MATPTRGIDQWREYFRTANSDIFEIIERAILVAASDCPDELKIRRLRIAELLFTARCANCNNRVEISEEPEFGGENGGGSVRCEFGGGGGSKESKANSSRDDDHTNHVSNNNYSYLDLDAAEALTDEIEEEDQILGEVLRIKEILNNYQDESNSVLYDSLRRLQLMGLSIKILKVTEIGKTVNGLRRHGSKQIRQLVRSLIEEWKAIVDEWVQSEQDTEQPTDEGTPDSVNPSVVNEEREEEYQEEEEEVGLPSPPLDEGALFATQNMDFAGFFDGMEDFGNQWSNPREWNKNRERKPPTVKQNAIPERKEVTPKERPSLSNENRAQQLKPKQSVPLPSDKPLRAAAVGPGRPLTPSSEQQTVKPVVKPQQIKPDNKPTIPRRPVPNQIERPKVSDEEAVRMKVEASKRKLQERYQEAQNAKKQRTIQVMELHDLPNRGVVQRNTQQGKFGNRNWANGRR